MARRRARRRPARRSGRSLSSKIRGVFSRGRSGNWVVFFAVVFILLAGWLLS